MHKQQKTKRGFTIIEVVLVLAIAGLIFMMVFLALPALQRSQRDTQRRDDMSQVTAQLQQYQANNRGKVPTDNTTVQDFFKAYLNLDKEGDSREFVDPDGTAYEISFKGTFFNGGTTTLTTDQTLMADWPNDHTIFYYTGAKCNGETVVRATGSRNAAIQYKLEGAGVYCGNV